MAATKLKQIRDTTRQYAYIFIKYKKVLRKNMSNKLIIITVLLLDLMIPVVTAELYTEDVKIEVDPSGYGYIDLGDYKHPYPDKIAAKATGWIVSPQDGTWTIRITVDDVEIFNESNITANQEFSKEIMVKAAPLFGVSKSRVKVYARWSKEAETTLEMHAKGCIKVLGKWLC